MKGTDLLNAPEVLLISLSLPGIDGHAGLGDGGSSMVLGGEDVAAGPLHISAQLQEGLNQHSCLDGHVQAASNASALQHLLGAVDFAHHHQARHLILGQFDGLAAPLSQGDVG